jgi:signal transduction histidine kinase/ActR/RegA family two-component response regulator
MPNGPCQSDADAEVVALRAKVAELERQLKSQSGSVEDLWARAERLRREAEALARIAVQEALSQGRVEDLAREITETASRVLAVERVGVWLFDDEERELRCIDNYLARAGIHESGAVLREHQFASEFSALKTSLFVDACDPLTDPRTAGYIEGYIKPNGISAMLDAVIRSRGRNLGVLCIEHVGQAHRWEPDEIAFACQLADQLALAIGERDRLRVEREREALQEQLLQAQKMESVGRLAGGVAHDINNFLGVILGNAELAFTLLDPDSPPGEYLREIISATRSSADLVRQLLAFARRQVTSPRVIELNENVAEMLRLLRRLTEEAIRIDWIPGEGLWPVRVDPAQVQQVLTNLVVNARDALAGRAGDGRIRIETFNRTIEPGGGGRTFGAAPGDYAVIAVGDNGPGLTPEAKKHIFEPFYTTKPAGRGTGLGLAIVYGIAQQNGGFVRVESEPGRGAAFEVHLPRSLEAAPVAEEDQGMAPRGGAETILVVEDQEMVRKAACSMLESLGYRVVSASSPDEALETARAHDGEIHLVLTDVILPGMNGAELMRAIARMRPGVRSLFMSGYTENVIAKNQVLLPGMLLLEKPFGMERLDTMVRQALAAPAKPV